VVTGKDQDVSTNGGQPQCMIQLVKIGDSKKGSHSCECENDNCMASVNF
jgi:hypothetical protein